MRYVKTVAKYLSAIEDGNHGDVGAAFKNGVLASLRWQLNLTNDEPIARTNGAVKEKPTAPKVRSRRAKKVVVPSFHPVPKPSEKEA